MSPMEEVSRARLKWLRSLHSSKGRVAEAAFLAEGARLIKDAVAAGHQPILLVVEAGSEALLDQLPEQVASAAVFAEAPDFRDASDTVNSQGLLAAFRMPQIDWLSDAAPAPATGGAVLICDNIRDPGNMGTLLRSAVAFGCAGAVLTKGCVDPFSPKVVRSAMGATFSLKFDTGLTAEELGVEMTRLRLPVWVLDASKETTGGVWPPEPEPCPAIVVGGETEGLSPAWSEIALRTLHIPQTTRIDSLNAAMAGTIALGRWYEARQQAAS